MKTLICALAVASTCSPGFAAEESPFAGCIPRVASLVESDGLGFDLGPDSGVFFEGAEAERVAQFFADWLRRGTGWAVPVQAVGPGGEASRGLVFALGGELAPEAYRIVVTDGRMRVTGGSGAGLFFATSTLRQSFTPELEGRDNWGNASRVHFPPLQLDDAPRFRWRGLMLDVGRYMYAPEDIKRLLDAMALLKLNVLQLHLTEDQGWRIEIKAHPRLTEVGAWRNSSPVYGHRNESDGVRYGGFYTQAELRDLVAYAAALHIDIMPEIELPGHSTAAIAAYPELGVHEFSAGLEVGTRWGVHPNTLNPSETTLRFYEDVFDEVIDIFPFGFVHIGGDEAPKGQWRDSPSVQARMAELGLANEEELQAWFVAHFEKYLAERGRRLVGWDEINEGGLPAGATMMVWRGWHYGVEAARAGHDIIMAPTSHTYFDYYQGPAENEPEAIGGLLPIEKVYAFEPVPEELTAEEAAHVLGGQAQLWSEYLPTFEQVEYMAFPRALALAEVLWSPKAARDWDDFERRLEPSMEGSLLEHLGNMGVSYRMLSPKFDVDAILFEGMTTFNAPNRGDLRYTVDGSLPAADSIDLMTAEFEGQLKLETSLVLAAASVRADGRVGPPARVHFVRVSQMEPGTTAALKPGLDEWTLPGARRAFASAADYAETAPVPIAADSIHATPQAAQRFAGLLEVDAPGIYTVRVGSDDGTRVLLGGEVVLDNGGMHGHVEKTARVKMPAGCFAFALDYFDAGGAASLELQIDGPGGWRLLRAPH